MLPIEDIILPEPPGMWPWPPGIWVLVILITVAAALSLRGLIRRWPYWQARRLLRRELLCLPADPALLNQRLHSFATEWLNAPAAVTGDAWPQWLIRTAPTLSDRYQQALQKLADAPYRRAREEDETVRQAILAWLQEVKR